jgi:endonuclease/exonuclease/phosphatase family metal-dependent hydrolase
MDIAIALALRVMTLNCAHGARAPVPAALVGRAALVRNLDAIGSAIEKVQPDVVALQEIDRGAFWSDRLDEVAIVAAGARMPHYVFGVHRDLPRLGLRQGTAVLSRPVPTAPQATAFNTTFYDDKGWVRVTVSPEGLGGRPVDIVSVHLDPFTPWARRRQITTMARELARRERPLVVMGDMNAAWGKRGQGDVAILARVLGLHAFHPHESLDTYPSGRPWRRIDWILLSPELDFASYAVVPTRVSDHRGVVADIVLRAGATSM